MHTRDSEELIFVNNNMHFVKAFVQQDQITIQNVCYIEVNFCFRASTKRETTILKYQHLTKSKLSFQLPTTTHD